jgi:PPP family 3-phenylpropionic acid transporter
MSQFNPSSSADAPPERDQSLVVSLLAAKGIYLLFFGALGALSPFFTVYLQQIGLSGAQIGLVGSVPPLLSLVANPFWSGLADRYNLHRAVLAVCALGAGLMAIPFTLTTDFGWILVTVVVMIFFRTPVSPLIDAAVLQLSRKANADYGRQRLWGSIGFTVASLSLGLWLAGDNLVLIFWIYGVMMAVGVASLSLFLPAEKSRERPNLLEGLRKLARQRSYLAFLLSNILFGFAAAATMNFLSLRMLDLGATQATVGLAFAINAVSEIPIMFLGGRLFRNVKNTTLITAGMVGLAVVYLIFGLSTQPWHFLVIIGFIGIFFAAYWMALVAYANDAVPAGLRATGQSLVGAAQGGLGWALGSVVSGVIWDSLGGSWVFYTAALSMALGAVVFWSGQKPNGREMKPLAAPAPTGPG